MPNVYITDEAHERLKVRAKQEGRTMRVQLDRDIREFLDQKDKDAKDEAG